MTGNFLFPIRIDRNEQSISKMKARMKKMDKEKNVGNFYSGHEEPAL